MSIPENAPKPASADQENDGSSLAASTCSLPAWHGDVAEGSSMLEALQDGCIFKINPTQDGKLSVWEMCDKHFGVTLTPSQAIQLGEEIIAMARESI